MSGTEVALGLDAFSQVGMLGPRYKPVNFGAGESSCSPSAEPKQTEAAKENPVSLESC